MKLINSVCSNLFFPGSRKNINEFRRMAQYLAGKGIECIEFYHDGDERDKIGHILADTGLNGVYIGVIPSKEGKLHLCDEDETGRRSAVKLFKRCIDEADLYGMTEVMLNSGHIGSSVEKGLSALERSVGELFEYAAARNYKLKLLMEPCDSGMDACQLIGPCRRTQAFMERVRSAGLPLELTLDSAHTVEEGEGFIEALTILKPYCSQIHFANCNIRDAGSPLYGDKHLGFEYPGTEWNVPRLEALFEELKDLYKDEEYLRIGLEVLCREDDAYRYFDSVWDDMKFLHRRCDTYDD